MKKYLGLVFVCLLAFAGFVAYQNTPHVTLPVSVAVQSPSEVSLAPLVNKVSDSVVQIFDGIIINNLDTSKKFADDAASGKLDNKIEEGSGVIFDAAKKYIITNYHVVSNDTKNITVVLQNKYYLKARLVYGNERFDLAIIEIVDDLPVNVVLHQSDLEDSSKVQIGDYVMAIGAPYELPQTHTFGRVSQTKEYKGGGYAILQIDAPINPGNSGGPLFDMDGKVIGIDSSIYSPTSGSVGIGFAIPSNDVANFIDQYKKYGKFMFSKLGVHISKIIDDDHIMRVQIVDTVIDGEADKAGLRAGDVLLSLNGEEFSLLDGAVHDISLMPAGKPIPFIIKRNMAGIWNTLTGTLTLGVSP